MSVCVCERKRTGRRTGRKGGRGGGADTELRTKTPYVNVGKKSQFYFSFWRSTLIREPGNRNFTSVFDDRTSFRAKGLRGTT